MLRITPLLATLALLLLLSPVALAQGEEETTDDESADTPAGEDDAPAEEAAETVTEGAEEAVEATTEGAEEAAEATTEAAEEAVEAATEAAESAEEAAEAATEAAESAEEAADVPAEEEAEAKPEIHLVAEAGALWLTGNTKSITANGVVNFSIAHKMNRFGLLFGGAYGRGVVADDPTNTWLVTATRVYGDLRYDRFFIQDVNSIYVTAGGSHDPFAGLDYRITAGGGYAHQLVKTDMHNLAVEGGFNWTRDDYVDGVDPTGQNFIGGRAFVGYRLTPSASFGFGQSIEGLFGGTDNQDAPFDGRLLSNTEITAQISKIFGLKLGFLVNWDFAPPEGFAPVDTTGSVTLVATLL